MGKSSKNRPGNWGKSKNNAHVIKPVLTLIPEEFKTTEDDKSKFISMDVKTKAGGPVAGNVHKKYLRIFEEGSPKQWIELVQEVRSIWIQNSIVGAEGDRAAMMHSVLKGESLVAFEAVLQDAMADPDDPEIPLTCTLIM